MGSVEIVAIVSVGAAKMMSPGVTFVTTDSLRRAAVTPLKQLLQGNLGFLFPVMLLALNDVGALGRDSVRFVGPG